MHETPNQAPNTQATPKTNNKNQNKIKNIPPKIEVSLPEPSPILANNNVVQEFSQSTPNAEAEESVMEVDESEVKVVGTKTPLQRGRLQILPGIRPKTNKSQESAEKQPHTR